MNLDHARAVLTEHATHSRYRKIPTDASCRASMINPLCGDQVEIGFGLHEGKISSAGFQAKACAICTASASLLCEFSEGRKTSEMETLFSLFTKSLSESADQLWPQELQHLNCFEHLRINPARRSCAILPWLTLRKAFPQI